MDINTGINPLPGTQRPVVPKKAVKPQAVAAPQVDPTVAALNQRYAELDKQRKEMAAADDAKSAKEEASLDEQHKANMDFMAATNQDMDKRMAAAPKNPQESFKYVQKNITDLTGQMLVLAALGGALVRQPMTAAMNNFSAAINGLVKGQKDDFEQQYQQYQENFKQAQEAHKEYMDDLKYIQEKHKGNAQMMLEEYHNNQLKHGYALDRRRDHIKDIAQEITEIRNQQSANEQSMKLVLARKGENDRFIAQVMAISQRREANVNTNETRKDVAGQSHDDRRAALYSKRKGELVARHDLAKGDKKRLDDATYAQMLRELDVEFGKAQSSAAPAGGAPYRGTNLPPGAVLDK